jgi:dephospho-CoA kinase
VTVGLTGGIGAGKSLISKLVRTLSYPVFNSDLEAKLLVEENEEIKTKIKDLLGEEAYLANAYNSAYVAKVVFGNQDKLNQLNSIIHPAVRDAFKKFVDQHKSKIVFNEAAILFETGAYQSFDKTILVCADEKIRIERVVKRDNSSVEEVKARIAKQWPDDQKRALADFVIENNDDESVLLQLNNILEKLNE